MKMHQTFFIHVVLGLVVSQSYAEETVRYVAVIFRHGQRTIIDPYPTDPWRNESLWPNRFGELTNEGKRQHYALGQWLRERYNHLISSEFDPKEIYVRSTDVDRTLMSAQANLAGLYPPMGKSVWNNNIMWQPIPIHTIPKKLDEVLAMEKPCPAYNAAYADLINSQEYKEGLSKYQKLMDYLTAYTGRKITGYDDILYIYSILHIENLMNFSLPNWTQNYYPEKMRGPACYSFRIPTFNAKLGQLKVGPFLQNIMHHVYDVIKPKSSTSLKFSMYSGHDNNVGAILNTLGLFDGSCPVFTSTILFELIHSNDTNSYCISIYYRNSTEIVEPNLLNIPYCGKCCPIERFEKVYDKLLHFNWEHECNGTQNEPRFSLLMAISFFVGLSILSSMYLARKIYFVAYQKQTLSSIPYTSVQAVAEKKNDTKIQN